VHNVFTKLQWFGIYFTILEVFDIMNKLRSPSVKKYQRLAGIHKWRKIIVISTIVIFESIQILFEIQWETKIIAEENLRNILQWSDIVA
jgi:hypothetical protein